MSAYLAVPWISAPLAEAAASAGVSVTTLKDAIADGLLAVHYVGAKATKPVIRAIDLDAWIEAQPSTRRNR